MAWQIDVIDGCAVVRMNSNKVNVQNATFFKDLHDAFDRLEEEFSELPVVLTGEGNVFSAGIDFKYSFDVFGSLDQERIREWYAEYRATNLRIFQYPRPTVAAINGHAIAGGLITALDCDFRIAARKPAKFGLNEVPIGIPMPAAYVEIIKYALGTQVGALTTLKGELYSLEEAEKLGFFHEVVEESELLSRAIAYARCITPDCNVAYAMSKKALQDAVIQQIEQRTTLLDSELPAGMSDAGNRRAQDLRRKEIMGA
ncbi:TPA: enoyl-CoA hydratase/isomerase family protein [Pseudomonas putida]|uniref:enoyl-CoA hydratase/isomerase family protein n=1 Tax=Pseudomonas putida TaxID=303 RepID=UPI00110CFD16|nr:enoyl-CoA hydratase/isomerase family protein [Pseudomonas putida]MDD1992659.1 enoyl-CoA hydratase/isomerase family protein [Pseudomonas putida]HDS0919680.1 enoyl-CoA hydratase/isomerase family protein [Pseudomonas putida]HDS0931780.1 enoyl-CoA hydratase/isomerase family protein [Pseudomonas putida]HDS1782408.1 enoyl-CoA hydratase/isomerase family protein [Pseudomonas putida]HDS3797057.1 enoyl-CoA hydratase/isomerase family protein [Pseudomonas putida]